MKRYFLIILAFLSFFSLLAQEASTINGVFQSTPYKKVMLFKVLNGRLVEIASSTPNDKGQFGFRFVPEYEGLYSLGTGNALSQTGLNRFYFKGKDDLNIMLTKDGGYELIGSNSKENKALFSWDTATKSIRDKAITPGGNSSYVDFFPQLEAFKDSVAIIAKTAKTSNTKFNQFYKDLLDVEFAYYAISYLYMPRTKHPKSEDMTPYYKDFNSDRYLNKLLLDLPYGDRFLNSLVFRKVGMTNKSTFAQQVDAIPVADLKGQFVLNRLEKMQSYAEFVEMKNQYADLFVLPEQKERLTAVEVKQTETKTGVAAFQFNFPDLSGAVVKLADLKGKVVVLDMWATWCGPCRAEEPHWEKLNEIFEGKPVAFVGISTDQDKSKWEQYIKEKNPKGIQLHAGVGNPLSKAYNVNTIPRYIVIDKAGNLVSADSPRPSDPKLKALIEEWLKK